MPLSLATAKAWYRMENRELREMALAVYSEEELEAHDFTDIKTFEDACDELGIRSEDIAADLKQLRNWGFEGGLGLDLIDVYKLNIIRKALNKGWEPNLTNGNVYYPVIQIWPAGDLTKERTAHNNYTVGATFVADGNAYSLIGGYYKFFNYGLCDFKTADGEVCPNLGLLGCETREIAKHMSQYFSKEIFNVVYSPSFCKYRWI